MTIGPILLNSFHEIVWDIMGYQGIDIQSLTASLTVPTMCTIHINSLASSYFAFNIDYTQHKTT